MHHHAALVACFVLALAHTPPSPAQPASLDELLEELVAEATVPGIAMAVVRDGRLRSLRFAGVRDASGAPVDEHTVFEAASLSKPVVAWLTLSLAEAGHLDLDTPLWEDVQPDRLAHDERARAITARMVLSHTTGLPNWGGSPLEFIADPGDGWGYSGEGFVLLQRALEARFGRSLNALAAEHVFDPLGMIRSAFVWQPAFDADHAVGHDLAGEPRPKQRPTEANAAASLHTTAGDYGRFLAALLSRHGLRATTIEAMTSPVSQVRRWNDPERAARLRWGLGWGLEPSGAGWSVWHWGDNGVFRCFVVGDPSTGDGLVYFTNSENGLSIGPVLIEATLGRPSPALSWLDYWTYDAPIHQARIRARQVFLHDGLAAGLLMLASYEEDAEARIPDDQIVAIARYLFARDHGERAIGLLEARIDQVPGEALLRGLAETQVSLRRYAEARASYEALGELQAVEAERMADDLVDDLAGRIAWLDAGLAAEASAVLPGTSALELIAGRYGPRVIQFEHGRLFYAREGGTARTALIPLSDSLFALESSADFRLEVKRDEDGLPVALIGRYADGRSDESPRSVPSPE